MRAARGLGGGLELGAWSLGARQASTNTNTSEQTMTRGGWARTLQVRGAQAEREDEWRWCNTGVGSRAAEWQGDRVAGWQNGRMAEWWSSRVAGVVSCGSTVFSQERLGAQSEEGPRLM
jgi:hypothetical protein